MSDDFAFLELGLEAGLAFGHLALLLPGVGADGEGVASSQ